MLFVLCYLAFSTTAEFLHGLVNFLASIRVAYQPSRAVTYTEISESNTIWQEKIKQERVPVSKQTNKIVYLWHIVPQKE